VYGCDDTLASQCASLHALCVSSFMVEADVIIDYPIGVDHNATYTLRHVPPPAPSLCRNT